MAPKQPCAKYQYVVTSTGPKILPVDEPSCKDEESPADYNAGGYLPVKVNDTFNNRYRVVRKLGWGHFSTVWLVKDAHTKRHSALKVVKSAGRYAETARDEIKLLSRVSSFSPSHPGRQHIVSFLDSFLHQGPEAQHVCIVFEPLGENLLALIERNKKKGVPRSLVKVITRQILLGLEYLHDECDLVHTDIKPENILISIPDIEIHIHNELSLSPLPTSRRVGVPLPAKTRAGVSIPSNPQRTRRQVQIFDSQPLASPGRSVDRSSSDLSISARLSANFSPSVTHDVQTSRINPSTTQANFTAGSSPPKFSSDLSASSPVQVEKKLAVKGITAIPSRILNSSSTSSSSSSISSAMVSTTVSTPPTSLSHSLGNAVMEFMGTGKFEAELRTRPGFSPVLHRGSEDDEREGLIIAKTSKTQNVGMTHPIPTPPNASSVVSKSWKDRVSLIFTAKSTSSPSKAIKHRRVSHPRSRSHSDFSNAKAWQDPGTAAPAPAVLVSAVVSADGKQDDFSIFSTVTDSKQFRSKSTSETSSANGTVVRPSPSSTPLAIGKKSESFISDIINRANDPSQLSHDEPSSSNFKASSSAVSGPNQCQHLSLLTQTAPSRPSATTRSSTGTTARVSPRQQVSHLSAHMHLNKLSLLCNCVDASHAHTHSHSGSKTQSSMAEPQAPTSVTPTPTSPSLAAPPSTPIDAPLMSCLVPTAANPSENVPRTPNVSIKIADLGNATPSKKHFTEEIQTRQYRAPEAILGRRDWDARADIWSVACVVFELLTAEYLFDPQGQGELFSKDDDHLAQVIELLGDFPLEAKMGGKYSRELFDHTGCLRYIRTLKPWPLKRVMVEKYLFSESDATLLCEFLEPLLAADMRDRAYARDIKDHKWLEMTSEDDTVTEW